MPDTRLVFLPLAQAAALIRTRKISPVELVRAHLDQIEALNPKVNAVLTVTAEHALAEARKAEKEIASGRYRGILHGIPYAPKDMLATKGIRTTNGSRVTGDWVPDFESTVTERLNRAGAILIAKLNLLEFAMGSGQRGLSGPARNPWDFAYSPSGSSSGSGAALAAGMVPLAVGTDSGGSIRGPAKSCGIVGLKPTLGRVSRFGVTTLSWTLDHVGPMARSVFAVAAMLEAMAGQDPRDSASAAAPVPSYTKALAGKLKGIRIGVPSGHFFQNVHPETDAALRRAFSTLKELGAALVETDVRHAAMASTATAVILGSESAAFHQKRLEKSGRLMDPLVRERLEVSSLYSAVDYIKALRIRRVMIEEMRRVFGLCDVMALPAGNAAPRLEEEIVETDAPIVPPATPRPDSFNIANLTGMPALVLPCGFTAGPPVLPLGMQLCGRGFEEATLFRVGHAYQSVTDWHTRVPPCCAV